MARAITADSTRPLTPEVVDPRLADVEKLARVMDDAIPIAGGFSIGLDGILGLVPGIGDFIGALISLYIVWRGVQLGVPRVTLVRMVTNIGIDAVVGSIPLFGDAFDFAWKSNRKNYELLRSHMERPRHQVTRDWLFGLAVAAVVIAVIALIVIAIVKVIDRPLF
jgi:hypothetical protein